MENVRLLRFFEFCLKALKVISQIILIFYHLGTCKDFPFDTLPPLTSNKSILGESFYSAAVPWVTFPISQVKR